MNVNHFENLKTRIQSSVKNTLAELTKTELENFKEQVKDAIQAGQSPVQGKGRFVKYSKAYEDAIKKGRYKNQNKKTRPVNLTLSGAMMNSLNVSKTSEGFMIGFKNELAYIHTVLGAGKSKTVRKLLPQKGEYFSNALTSYLKKIVSDSWVDSFNKNKAKLGS